MTEERLDETKKVSSLFLNQSKSPTKDQKEEERSKKAISHSIQFQDARKLVSPNIRIFISRLKA